MNIIKTFAEEGLNVDINQKPNTIENAGDLDITIGNILNIIIGSLGVIAVIVIIIGGVLYMTSSGDRGKVKKAKDTILYGVIGLIICVLAAAIVNFVIANVGDEGQQGGGRGTTTQDFIYRTVTSEQECGELGGWDYNSVTSTCVIPVSQ